MNARQEMPEIASRGPFAEGTPLDSHTESGVTETPSEAMTRIARLVATIKADRAAEGPLRRAIDTGDRSKLVALLRQFVAAREQERATWDDTLKELRTELDKAHAAAQAAQGELAEQKKRHQRMAADLELMQEHQRSIWLLDRRRLEITIAGLEAAQNQRGSRFRARLGVTAALVIVGVIGLVLAGDTGRAAGFAGSRSDLAGAHSLSYCAAGCDLAEPRRL